jgi:hypothetical protein
VWCVVVVVVVTAVSMNIQVSAYWISFVFSLHEE